MFLKLISADINLQLAELNAKCILCQQEFF